MSFRVSAIATFVITLVVVAHAWAQPTPTSAPPTTPPVVRPKVKDVDAGPLYDQAEADKTCPNVCKPPTKWNGSWRTTKPGIMSVCGCAEPAPPAPPPPPPAAKTRDVDAGPLMDQNQATTKCPQVCKAPATWTGAWRTTKPGVMSTCTCQDPLVKTVETSSIKSSTEAKAKCTKACAPPLQWSGEWKKTGKKSATCDCFDLPAATPPVAPKS